MGGGQRAVPRCARSRRNPRTPRSVPADQQAGTGLLIGLVIAYCNAVASAQLGAVYSIQSGSIYTYGRERLGDWCGFITCP
jgi:hypothetical protein